MGGAGLRMGVASLAEPCRGPCRRSPAQETLSNAGRPQGPQASCPLHTGCPVNVNGFVKPSRAGSGNARGPRVHGLWSPCSFAVQQKVAF